MTLSASTARVRYSGDGATTAFTVTFKFYEQTELTVVLTSSAGVDTVQTMDTHYTVSGGISGGDPATGTVTMITPPAIGETLTILRNMDFKQETDFPESGAFPAKAQEQQHDKAIMSLQQLREEVDRAIKFAQGSTQTDIAFPEPSASKAIAWNLAGDGLENIDAPTTALAAAEAAQTAAEAAQSAAETAQTGAETAQTAAEAAADSVNVGLSYTWSSTTTMADPGSGNLRFNNATVSSVTAIAINDLTSDSDDLSAFITTWVDSTNTLKGHLIIQKEGDTSVFAIFSISALIDNSGWSQITVAHVVSTGTFSNTDPIDVQFMRAGDKGADGEGSGDLISTNNLSDVADVATARGNLGLLTSSDVLITVGSGGDYSSLSDALAQAQNIYTIAHDNGGITVEIRFLTGFTMAEQVHVIGNDFGFVTLTSVDATVTVDYSAITTDLFDLDDTRPFLAGSAGAVLPMIGCLFSYDSNTTALDGIALRDGSRVRFLPSASDSATPISGVRNARRALVLLGGSEAVCHIDGLTQGAEGLAVGVDLSSAANRAIQAQHGSRFSLPKSILTDCEGDNAVYVIWSSSGDLYQSDVTGHTGSNAAVHVRDGSVLCAREVDVSGANARGFHALHAAVLDARSGVADNCGTYGLLASGGSIVDFTQGSADGGQYGVHASEASRVNAGTLSATSCTARGVSASGGSSIFADDCDVAGSEIGVYADQGSLVSADSGDLSNCGTYGIECQGGSTVHATGATISGCGTAVYAWRGSTVNCRAANLSSATTYGAYSNEASTINAHGCNAGSAGTTGFNCIRGAVINAGSATGTLSKTANTVTADGIIYQ